MKTHKTPISRLLTHVLGGFGRLRRKLKGARIYLIVQAQQQQKQLQPRELRSGEAEGQDGFDGYA